MTEHKGGFISGDVKAEFHRDLVLPHAQIRQLEKLAESITKLMTEIKTPVHCDWCGGIVCSKGKMCGFCMEELFGIKEE